VKSSSQVFNEIRIHFEIIQCYYVQELLLPCYDMIDGTKVMPTIFFSENIIAAIVKLMWMIHTSFTIMRLFFHRVFIIFNTLLPTLSKTLYTSVVKFPALTLENIIQTLFSSLPSVKLHQHSAFFTGPDSW
jgi:hypothetical protein